MKWNRSVNAIIQYKEVLRMNVNFYNVHADALPLCFHRITEIVQYFLTGGEGFEGGREWAAMRSREEGKHSSVLIDEASQVAGGALLFSITSLVPHRRPPSSRCSSLVPLVSLAPYWCSGRGFLTPGTVAIIKTKQNPGLRRASESRVLPVHC